MRGTANQARARPAWTRHVLLIGLLAVTLATASAANARFASLENVRDLLVQAAPAIIVGCGMTLVVLTGEIDISVGGAMGLLAALIGYLASAGHLGWPVWATVAAVLTAGAAIGLINGILVALGRVPSIIATLGTMTVLRGTTEVVMRGRWITDLPAELRWLGTGTVAGMPVCIWVAAVVVGIGLIVTRRTAIGVRLYAVGGNPLAAAMARISAGRVRLAAFIAVGTLTALAALVSVPQQSVVESGIGDGFEMVVITAVVVGGTSIRGGYGGVAGMVLAAILLGSIRTSLLFMNLGDRATYWERAIQGAFILAAVLGDHVAGRRRRAEGEAHA